MAQSASRSIPSLDGLRACSVAVVIVAHSLVYFLVRKPAGFVAPLSLVGGSGVDVFFVISGFLITHLLLRELEAKGSISLKNFYFRRFFRIFPPFYAYLLVLAILSACGLAALDKRSFVTAALYLGNYLSNGSTLLLQHTWSLSLEEQFYLIWPPCLVLLGKRRSTIVAMAVIVTAPLVRFACYVLLPSMRGREGLTLHTRLDTLMFGCAMALLWKADLFNRVVDRLRSPALTALSVLYILVGAPYSAQFLGAKFAWSIGYSLNAFCISVVLLNVVRHPESTFGKFLNLPWMRHLGVISYSLYLWQQMFTVSGTWLPVLNIVPIVACAELSYWLIERPSFRLRDRLELRFIRRSPSFVPAMTVLSQSPQHADSR